MHVSLRRPPPPARSRSRRSGSSPTLNLEFGDVRSRQFERLAVLTQLLPGWPGRLGRGAERAELPSRLQRPGALAACGIQPVTAVRARHEVDTDRAATARAQR